MIISMFYFLLLFLSSSALRPHANSWLIGKDSDAGRDWGQEEKGTTEDEMTGWHHWLNGRESGWTSGVGDGQEVLGARVRHSAHGKGHEEGGSTYAKAGSSLRSAPGNPRASTPITRACLLYYFVLPPTPLTLRGAVPHHFFRRRS